MQGLYVKQNQSNTAVNSHIKSMRYYPLVNPPSRLDMPYTTMKPSWNHPVQSYSSIIKSIFLFRHLHFHTRRKSDAVCVFSGVDRPSGQNPTATPTSCKYIFIHKFYDIWGEKMFGKRRVGGHTLSLRPYLPFPPPFVPPLPSNTTRDISRTVVFVLHRHSHGIDVLRLFQFRDFDLWREPLSYDRGRGHG